MNYESWTDEDVSLQTYFSEIASSTPLSRAKEAELAERIAAGDNRAREELAEANLLFVVTVAKQYRNRGLSFSELISAGNLGLMTAVDRFDATRGFKFISSRSGGFARPFSKHWLKTAALCGCLSTV